MEDNLSNERRSSVKSFTNSEFNQGKPWKEDNSKEGLIFFPPKGKKKE